MSRHVIGFAGRLQSGKTELAKICEEFGYVRLSVALPLKEMVATLLLETVEGVNMLKTANNHYEFDQEDREYIAYRTQIPIDIINNKLTEKVFKNTREIMQFIGTDLIREYNSSWHVDELRKMMSDENGKYVIDDIRFPNERALIEELGGTCWFIIRPKLDNVLNHESETSLKWQEFSHILVNDKDVKTFQNGWRRFMENYNMFLEKRTYALESIPCLGLHKEEIEDLLISPWQLYYQEQDLSKLSYKDGGLYKLYIPKLKGCCAVLNPFIIEDFKFTL